MSSRMIQEEAKREAALQRAEAIRRGQPWPPPDTGEFDWYRWFLYAIWSLPLAYPLKWLATRAIELAIHIGDVLPGVLRNPLGSVVGGLLVLGAAGGLYAIKVKSRASFATFELSIALAAGWEGTYQLFNGNAIAGGIAVAGAAISAVAAIENYRHALRKTSSPMRSPTDTQ